MSNVAAIGKDSAEEKALAANALKEGSPSGRRVHGKCTRCSPRGYCRFTGNGAKCAMSMDARTGRSRQLMKDEIRGAYMFGPTQEQSRSKTQVSRSGALARINFSKASTADIRAYLSELKTLPRSHRRLLCKLLRRAAMNAPGKVSVVPLADPHQKTKL